MSSPPARSSNESEDTGSFDSIPSDASLPPRSRLARDASGTFLSTRSIQAREKWENSETASENSSASDRKDSEESVEETPAQNVQSTMELPRIWRETSSGGPRRRPTFKEQTAGYPPLEAHATRVDKDGSSASYRPQDTSDSGNDFFDLVPMATATPVDRKDFIVATLFE